MEIIRVALGTTSRIKFEALKLAHERLKAPELAFSLNAVSSGVSRQPVGLQETSIGARTRAETVRSLRADGDTLCIGIENGLMNLDSSNHPFNRHGPYIDQAIVHVISPESDQPVIVTSIGISVPLEVAKCVLARRILAEGVSTVGEALAAVYPNEKIDPEDPHKFLCGRSRVDILADAIYTALLKTSLGANAPERKS